MDETEATQRSLRDYLWLAARGFCMGAADIVPGVSGGTMAFILGIYDELLEAINAINKAFLRSVISLRWREALAGFPWQFLLAVGLGIGAAVLSLSNLLHWALDAHPSLVMAFFFGLIVASIDIVRRRLAWKASHLLLAVIAAIGAYTLVGLTPAETPHTPLLLFLSGAIAICAMILPGISGAFILVLLGKYRFVLGAVVQRDILTILLVGLGAVVGLLSFARLLRWLLKHYHDLTVAALAGFMLGSLRKVWPWKTYEAVGEIQQEFNFIPESFSTEVILALLLMLAGIGFVLLIEWQARRQGKSI
jgi:putative membrane protein